MKKDKDFFYSIHLYERQHYKHWKSAPGYLQLVMSAESCCRFLKCYGVLELDWGGSFTVVWISWSSFECCLWDVWVLWHAILHYYWYKQSKIHILKHPFSSPGNYLQEVFWEAGTVSTASLLVSEDSGSAKSKNSSF